jgi:hypothetical protein
MTNQPLFHLFKICFHLIPLYFLWNKRFVLLAASVLFVLLPYIKYYKYVTLGNEPKYRDDPTIAKQATFWRKWTFIKGEV